MTNSEIAWLIAGFLTGFFLVIGLSLLYFFEADRTINRQMTPLIANPKLFKSQFKSKDIQLNNSRLIHVELVYERTIFDKTGAGRFPLQ